MKSTFLLHLSLIAISVCFALVILELGARYYYYRWNTNQSVPFVLFSRVFPESDDLRNAIQASGLKGVIFELKPNNRFEFFSKRLQTNSVGMISEQEYTPEKPPNTLRIAGVGDSVMFPWGVGERETYLHHIGNQLAQTYPNKHVEMLNFSVPGYNTAQEYSLILEKVLLYHPDIIILGFCNNDLDMPNYIRRQVTTSSYLVYMLRQSIQLSMCRLGEKYCQYQQSTSLFDEPFSEKKKSFPDNPREVPAQYRYMIGKDNYVKAMRNLASITIAQNIPVILTTAGDYKIADLFPQIQAMGYLLFPGDQHLRDYLRENKLRPEDIQLNSEDTHFNAFGHQVFANLLYQFMLDNRKKLHLE